MTIVLFHAISSVMIYFLSSSKSKRKHGELSNKTTEKYFPFKLWSHPPLVNQSAIHDKFTHQDSFHF